MWRRYDNGSLGWILQLPGSGAVLEETPIAEIAFPFRRIVPDRADAIPECPAYSRGPCITVRATHVPVIGSRGFFFAENTESVSGKGTKSNRNLALVSVGRKLKSLINRLCPTAPEASIAPPPTSRNFGPFRPRHR